MTVIVYTANFGGRDEPRPQAVQQGVDVEWRYFTDDPALNVPAPWHRVVEPAIPGEHPNLAAKWYKTHPAVSQPGDVAIWIDASMEVTSERFAWQAIDALGDALIAVWKHPRRNCVYQEAEASLGAEGQGGRYDSLPIREQVAEYHALGYPAHHGLYACGTIVWTYAAVALGEAWWRECENWGYQDQISFPFVCWALGITPATFPVPQISRRMQTREYLANPWLRIWPHKQGTD